MAKAKDRTPPKAWSLRSQRSLKRQYELEDEIGKFQKLIGFEEKMIAAAEVNRTRQAKMVIGGQPIYQRNLTDSIAEIEQRKQKISAFQETIAALQSEIKGLQPTAAQAADRAHKQAELARLADERMEAVASIDAAIHVLRQRLNIYGKLTEAMVKLAGEIDFSGQNFDSTRFDTLAAGLPVAMQRESTRWLESFLGEEADRRACEIVREFQSFPETLAAAHYYRRGEKPLLTEKERVEMQKREPHGLSTIELEALGYSPRTRELQVDTRNFPGNGILA